MACAPLSVEESRIKRNSRSTEHADNRNHGLHADWKKDTYILKKSKYDPGGFRRSQQLLRPAYQPYRKCQDQAQPEMPAFYCQCPPDICRPACLRFCPVIFCDSGQRNSGAFKGLFSPGKADNFRYYKNLKVQSSESRQSGRRCRIKHVLGIYKYFPILLNTAASGVSFKYITKISAHLSLKFLLYVQCLSPDSCSGRRHFYIR